MCDYSLEAYQSRPARKGERYVTHRFQSGSVGLTAAGNCSAAVCVAPDMRLRLQGISKDVQNRFGVGPEEDVAFVRWDDNPTRYRDAVKFNNGAEVSLQDLEPGVTVIVTATLEVGVERPKVMA